MANRLKEWARGIKRDVRALYLASRDPRVPWYAKALGIAVAAYALSPIDLIPDFVPVLGYLDDLVIVPIGIFLVVRLIPPEIMAEHRAAADASDMSAVGRKAAAVVVIVWIASAALVGWLAYRWFALDSVGHLR
jgi:uncharacterized membrane protein YkvA (DUF1232 family)